MKVRLESTTKIVQLKGKNGAIIEARVWQGQTAADVPCHAYITLIAARTDANHDEFSRELLEQAAPRPDVEAIPFRMLI